MQVLMIGAAGSLLGPVIARALATRGSRVIRGWSPGDPPLPSRFHHETMIHPPLTQHAALEGFLRALARTNPGLVSLPENDSALAALDALRGAIDPALTFAMPPANAVGTAMDKAKTAAFANKLHHAIGAPPTLEPDPQIRASDQWTGRYPVIVKPRTGSGSEGVRFARNEAELDAAFAATARHYHQPIIQEAIVSRPGGVFNLLYLFDPEGRLRS